MADKNFVDGYVFWDKFAFRYIFYDPRTDDNVRYFNHDDAKRLWDCFVYLKIKCPSLDIKGVIN